MNCYYFRWKRNEVPILSACANSLAVGLIYSLENKSLCELIDRNNALAAVAVDLRLQNVAEGPRVQHKS